METPKFSILGISFTVRLAIMLIIFYLPIDTTFKILLILAGDFLDCWTTKTIGYLKYDMSPMDNLWCKEFSYQLTDKLLDVVSYLLVIRLLPANPIYIGLVIYRLVGIGLFYKTRDSGWLILFPDLFKEVVIYNLFLGNLTGTTFLLIVSAKVVFEFVWHRYVNGNHYKRPLNNKN